MVLLSGATFAAGQDIDPEGGTTSSVPGTTQPADPATSVPPTTVPSTTTSTVPSTVTPKPGVTVTTTTLPPVTTPPVTIPPELAADPRAPVLYDPDPFDGGEVPVAQGLFDPGTNQVLADKVAEMTAAVETGKRILGELQAAVIAQQVVVEDLVARYDALGTEAQRSVAAAAEAERALRDHAVDTFINGTSEEHMSVVRTGDPVQMGVARELLVSVVERDERLIAQHKATKEALDSEQAGLAEDLSRERARLDELDAEYRAALTDTANAAQGLAAYQNGSQVYVKGFVFPVQGDTEFIDSWGYPRMTGTSSAHWHQGTDVFAEWGTPLVACESGTLDRIGTASLGGQRLWIKGDSGTDYYYAHLSAFAPGITQGMRVNAGDVVGYVGDTGNARGTPPHLHFEVHPGGGAAVNPYPILKATYGTKPMVQIVEAPAPQVPVDQLPLDQLGLGQFTPATDPARAGG